MLKERLEKQTWYKISDLFYFCGYSAADDKKELPGSARGRWVTHGSEKGYGKIRLGLEF